MERASGVLMHISSLPSPYGIGSFGKAAYDFVDFLEETKQSYWQILPLTTTSYGDSPYQSFSAFAGNTHFIDLEVLIKEGYLKKEDVKDVHFGDDCESVDYGLIFNVRRPLLEKAVENFLQMSPPDNYYTFIETNSKWLLPFADYMTIKEQFDLKPWFEWDDEVKCYNEEAVDRYRKKHASTYSFHLVTQYFFNKQWMAIKDYANDKGIQIIGDLPIYVAHDSVEMWTSPELFKVDEDNNLLTVAGTPPDNFSDDGQFWGNPIYNWVHMKQTGYKWWIWRLEESLKLYDIVRIDHFRGFESFWEVPFGDDTARNGQWSKGPGIDLFKTIKEEMGELPIIAEDLGFMTDEVKAMREYTGYPGMVIFQFGFNGYEDSTNLPHHYTKNSVVYVGTHDNDTGRGWYEGASKVQRNQFDRYMNRREDELVTQAQNRGIAASVCDTAIYTMQDLLDLPGWSRMNTPNTIGQNWKWRMKKNAITPDIKKFLLELTETYFRTPKE